MTYERDADVWIPYLPRLRDIEFLMARKPPPKNEPAPLVLFQSAPIDRCGRYAFAAELMRHVHTDSYGRQLNNRTLPWPDRGGPTKRVTVSRYKFTLALENSIAPDYVTEKLFQPLIAGSVPVYRGASNVAAFAPGPKSYIDATDFASPKDLADYLNALDRDDAAYAAYFAWRQAPSEAFMQAVRANEENQFARLGRAIRLRMAERAGLARRTIYPFSRMRRTLPALRRAVARLSPV
jgi:alpha-1,3-fucosyltransferase 10